MVAPFEVQRAGSLDRTGQGKPVPAAAVMSTIAGPTGADGRWPAPGRPSGLPGGYGGQAVRQGCRRACER